MENWLKAEITKKRSRIGFGHHYRNIWHLPIKSFDSFIDVEKILSSVWVVGLFTDSTVCRQKYFIFKLRTLRNKVSVDKSWDPAFTCKVPVSEWNGFEMFLCEIRHTISWAGDFCKRDGWVLKWIFPVVELWYLAERVFWAAWKVSLYVCWDSWPWGISRPRSRTTNLYIKSTKIIFILNFHR